MKIVAVSDIHGSAPMLESMRPVLRQADLVLLTGDITHFGGEEAARKIIDPIRTAAGVLYGVAGNCDYPDVDDYLTREKLNLHGRAVQYGGIGIAGLGGSLVTPFHTPLEYTEEELGRALSEAYKSLVPGLPWILVSHQPPYGTNCDRLRSGAHVGSHAVRAFIEEKAALVCLTGHIHESAGLDAVGRTRIINPGPLAGGRYAYAEISDDAARVLEIRKVSPRGL